MDGDGFDSAIRGVLIALADVFRLTAIGHTFGNSQQHGVGRRRSKVQTLLQNAFIFCGF